jgi:hypothetical protein
MTQVVLPDLRARRLPPEAGIATGSECRPCLNDRERAAAASAQAQDGKPPTGNRLFRRPRS